ncbi:MAG TPA: aminoglycoside phosphotransferase [Desulfobulbus sp.]|nr:aminoglycoside phosphotransferase [Desulfobulbus sp.]
MERCRVAAGKFFGLSNDQWHSATVRRQAISPDGSQRIFVRLTGPGERRLLFIQPPEGDEPGLLEARSACHIGKHLHARGIPVPKIYGFDPESGRLCVEDLGDDRLHALLVDASEQEQLQWYTKVIEELVRMQIRGADDFSPSWCWDTSRYDRRLMLERESGYFLRALCSDFFGLSFDRQIIDEECRLLADRASRAPADFFLHRDFQSRNIMITDNTVRIIDYQGGRLGPLAYDLASLLIDPYMGLSPNVQAKVKEQYFATLRQFVYYDREQFEREYLVLALQRNLQILGAFAFLSKQRGKVFFTRYIEPALHTLSGLLAKPAAADYDGLRELARLCLLHCRSYENY